MAEIQSTIRAYQKVLSTWVFEEPSSFAEEFAIKRFQKKMEVPDSGKREQLHQKAWNDFLTRDESLPGLLWLPTEWLRAKAKIKTWLSGNLRRSPIDFPKGSSVVPTGGFNSIEFRLAGGPWTCTPENFDEFSSLVYHHKALKRAMRRRYSTWFRKMKFSISFKEADALLWQTFRDRKDPGWAIFRFKMSRIVLIVRGSRFSTVPKNNETRRPINIEPFGNILVQRRIGNYLRLCLKNQGLDLDRLAEEHRIKISNLEYATIDLSNASDLISEDLVRCLVPSKLWLHLERCKSHLIYGPDNQYHTLKKISSMGNGFTFELMTLILNALCQVLDPSATVFGDDIIIKSEQASTLMNLLEMVGLKVNRDKSFVKGLFRESCGANYHAEHGYIKSYDFLYPEHIGLCALALTKAYALRDYPQFAKLYDQLLRRTPKALRGGPVKDPEPGADGEVDLCVAFACDSTLLPPSKKVGRMLKRHLLYEEVREGVEFTWRPQLRSHTSASLINRYHWAKYEMYLQSARITDDVVSGRGRWVIRKVYITENTILRFDAKYLQDLASAML